MKSKLQKKMIEDLQLKGLRKGHKNPTCVLYEIITAHLPEKKPRRRRPWLCSTCGGLIRWRKFIPCPRGVG